MVYFPPHKAPPTCLWRIADRINRHGHQRITLPAFIHLWLVQFCSDQKDVPFCLASSRNCSFVISPERQILALLNHSELKSILALGFFFPVCPEMKECVIGSFWKCGWSLYTSIPCWGFFIWKGFNVALYRYSSHYEYDESSFSHWAKGFWPWSEWEDCVTHNGKSKKEREKLLKVSSTWEALVLEKYKNDSVLSTVNCPSVRCNVCSNILLKH